MTFLFLLKWQSLKQTIEKRHFLKFSHIKVRFWSQNKGKDTNCIFITLVDKAYRKKILSASDAKTNNNNIKTFGNSQNGDQR